MRVAAEVLAISVVGFSLVGCSPPQAGEPSSFETAQQALWNATVTDKHLAMNEFAGCTSTVVAPRWLLTASHCVNFSEAVPSTGNCVYKYVPLCRKNSCSTPPPIAVQKIVNFGPALCKKDDLTCCKQNQPVPGDLTSPIRFDHVGDPAVPGNNDVALVLLTKPVPASIVPASIATHLPSAGDVVSTFGVGIYLYSSSQQSFQDGQLRYADWTYPTFESEATYTTLIDSVGFSIYPGDSGGASIFGSGQQDGNDQVWAVTSRSTGSKLTPGGVVQLRPQICGAMYKEEPHTWCVPGGPLIVPASGCESEQGAQNALLHTHEVITYVCRSNPSCCDPGGRWSIGCVTAGAQYTKDQGWPDVCGRDAWSQGPIFTSGKPPQYFPRDFNLFVLAGNAEAFVDVEGPIAAQNQINSSNFRLNWGFHEPQPIALIAGGTIALQNGAVVGDIYAPVLNKNASVTIQGNTTLTTSPIIDFGKAAQKLQAMSQALAAYPNTPCTIQCPAVSVGSNGSIALQWNDPQLNVFTLTSSQLVRANSATIDIGAPAYSTVIINVTGGTGVLGDPSPSFKNMTITLRGRLGARRLLWNFPSATSITMASVNVPGSILAPSAVVTLQDGGDIAGTLVAKSASNAWFQLHWAPFVWPVTQ